VTVAFQPDAAIDTQFVQRRSVALETPAPQI